MLIMSDDLQTFATLLHQCAALWRSRLDERLRPWGISQTAWRTLWLLNAAEERYNQSTLAHRLGIETPTLVRMLDRLESLSLVQREPDSRDRRQKYVVITPHGKQLMAEVDTEVIATRRRMLAGIDADELSEGIALVERIIGNARSMGGQGKP